MIRLLDENTITGLQDMLVNKKSRPDRVVIVTPRHLTSALFTDSAL
jgi:hypothetical protein